MPKRKRGDLTTRPLEELPEKQADPLALSPKEPATQPVTDSLVETLSRLVSGEPAANQAETMLLFKWNHLTKWERYALAAEWNLPYTGQSRHDQLARQAKEKLR